jgi:lipoyl(octanoyl) transferase
VINVLQFGRIGYAQGLEIQARIEAARKAGEIEDTLLLLEHTPVITLGRNARDGNIVVSREQLAARGVEVFECNRGGDVTYHGPGQLVGYPIFDLRSYSPRIGAVEFVRKIEEVLIRTCAEYGVVTQRVAGRTGVWTRPIQREGARANDSVERKIAAIGVHISRFVTSHGFALNVSTDLDHFKLIVPCGIGDKPVTSLQKEVASTFFTRAIDEITVEEVAEAAARNFGVVFGKPLRHVMSLEALLGPKVDIPAKPPRELREMHGGEAALG